MTDEKACGFYDGVGALLHQADVAGSMRQTAFFQDVAHAPTTVATLGSTDGRRPALSGTVDGWALGAWQDAGSAPTQIRFRWLDAAGSPFGLEATPSDLACPRQRPDVAGLPDGGAAIVWQERLGCSDSGPWEIHLALLGADHALDALPGAIHGAAAGHQTHPRVAAAADGRILVVWVDGSGDAPQIVGRVLAQGVDD